MVLMAFFQIVLAVVLVAVLLIIGFAVYSTESTRAVQKLGRNKKQTTIFEGVKDLAVTKNESYHTLNPSHPTYRDLEPSINQKAGAEYTYNFWLYLATDAFGPAMNMNTAAGYFPDSGMTVFEEKTGGEPSGTSDAVPMKPFVVLLRGDKNAVAYRNLCDNTKADVLIKNPMVKIEKNGRVLAVEINTLQTPDGVRDGSRDTCKEGDGSWDYMNSHRIALENLNSEHLVDKWFMVTLVVQDTYPKDALPIRNKVRVCLYINGVNELDRYLDGELASVGKSATVLRNAPANLYIAPTVTLGTKDGTRLSQEMELHEKVMMADLRYYNYALEPEAITAQYRSGFTKKFAAAVSSGGAGGAANNFMDSMAVPVEERVLAEVRER